MPPMPRNKNPKTITNSHNQQRPKSDKKMKKHVNRTTLRGYEEKNPKMQNSMINHDRKHKIQQNKKLDNKRINRQIYLHNYTLKFPLHPLCKIPFSNNIKAVHLKHNSYYLYKTKSFLVKQTTKNLFITPYFSTMPAQPGNAKELSAKTRAKCLAFVKKLQKKYIDLKVFKPANPVTQEYAVKDDFAKRLNFTFANELGKFDKSVRIDADGHKITGAEIEYFRPEHADLYLKMPLLFKGMADTFSSSLVNYNKNIELHLSVLRRMGVSLSKIDRALQPKRLKMPTSLKKSATLRGVN